MSRRLHVTVSDRHYVFLDAEANRSSVSIAELVRRSLDSTYGLHGEKKVIQITHTVGRRAGRRIN